MVPKIGRELFASVFRRFSEEEAPGLSRDLLFHLHLEAIIKTSKRVDFRETKI